MYKLILTESELNNLKIFLARASLSGGEAAEFMKLADKIGKAEVVKDTTERG